MSNFYKKDVDEIFQELNTSKDGLSEEEAQNRLRKDGLNKLVEKKKQSLFVKFLAQFKDVMLIILLIAAVVSGVVSYKTGESFTDSIIILFVVILNAILGMLQEAKAEKAIEALKSMSLPYIKTRRNGKIVSTKVEELVVGDIVLLEAGDYVPADLRIVETHSLKIEEAALTGESLSVEKTSRKLSENVDLALGDRKNMAYSGSNVVYGRGEGVVIATAMNTELGKIADALSNQKVEITPLQKKMNELSKILSIFVIVIAIIMFIIGYLQGNAVINVFMLAISLAVAAIPEGLSAVITITLAIGVQKMAKENAIVRKLSAVEALGSTEVICTDKTGTLTENKMKVRKVLLGDKTFDVTSEEDIEIFKKFRKDNKFDVDTLINSFALCNDTTYGEDNGNKVTLGDPTETALVEFTDLLNTSKEELDENCPRISELPFDSNRKMMSTLNEVNGNYYVYTKGATESIIENCTRILLNGKVEDITEENVEYIKKCNHEMANSALRVLAFAYKEVGSDEKINEKDLIFVGLSGMMDTPRKEVFKAVERCFNAGMIPVMITGDNIDTAIAIARELKILDSEKQAITGLELDKMSDEEFIKNVENFRVYARVSPENKIRIVRAWKKKGKIVAMTGDGVNDAPAIKGADIGVGMGITGTEVSKSVSSMVLADDNFATIVLAVKEGRRIYANIQNAIAYLLASNLAEILILFIASLLNQTILLPIQILWINLVTDTIPAIALGFEKEAKDIMRQKPRAKSEGLFTPFMVFRIIIPAIIKVIAVYSLYFILKNKYSHEILMSVVFITLSTIEILFAYTCRSDRKSILKIGFFSNLPMVLCVLGTLFIQSTVIFTPLFASLLKIEILDYKLYIIIFSVCLISSILFEIVKVILGKIFYRKKS